MIEDSSIFVKMPSELHIISVQTFSIIAGIQRAFRVKFFFLFYIRQPHMEIVNPRKLHFSCFMKEQFYKI